MMYKSNLLLLSASIVFSSKNLFTGTGVKVARFSTQKCEKLTNAKGLLDGIDMFIFDCDGVLWRGNELIDGTKEVLDFLRANKKQIFFVTNNSRKSRKALQSKFIELGLNVSYEEVLSSSYAAATYLTQEGFQKTKKKVYVLGDIGISEELALKDIKSIGGPEHNNIHVDLQKDTHIDIDPDIGAVVVGLDTNINYYKLQYAQLCLNNIPNCYFIATNEDQVGNLTPKQQWVGGGGMVGALKGCTGREPTVVGKPSSLLIDIIVKEYRVKDVNRICMVGDRLDTDVLFGVKNGLKTLLVLTGVTTEDGLFSEENLIKPDFYTKSIYDLIH